MDPVLTTHHHDEGLAEKVENMQITHDRDIDQSEAVIPNGNELSSEDREAEQARENALGLDGNQDDRKSIAGKSLAGKSLANGDHKSIRSERPTIHDEPSRSYLGNNNLPIVTTYDEQPEAPKAERRRSVTSTKAPSIKKAASIKDSEYGAHRAPSTKAPSIRSTKAGTVNGLTSPAPEHRRLPQLAEDAAVGGGAGFAVGEIASAEQQRHLQRQSQQGHQLHDQGSLPRDRSTTFDTTERAQSPRPSSAFGHRPEPQIMSAMNGNGNRSESRADQGRLDRSGTVLSRAGTLGRNGTLSRGANGGTIGSRRGAFGRGAGASVGTQPEEVLGRDDIHTRAELSERILDDATLRKLSTMEKKDAKRLSKVIKAEGKAENKAVQSSIKELERLSKLQREAASTERKSQLRLSKWTRREHKARLRFLKEKERYEKIEGELRNSENDYEERRDHAAGLTSQVAERSQELDDLRGQKAADDREREVKLLALKNPAHS